MASLNNSRKKTKLKKLIKLKINILYNLKILKFKKKKWKSFLYFFKNQLKPSKFKKYKIIDQIKTLINKKSLLELNYKNQHFKKLFFFSKLFNFFFGCFSKNYYYCLKSKLKKSFKTVKKLVIEFLESRLDLILYRAKFCSTIKCSKQFITHNHVIINKVITKNNSSVILKSGDLISLNLLVLNSYKKNLVYSSIWPVTPNYLVVNYKTVEIIFLGNAIKSNNFIFYSCFWFNMHRRLIF